MSAREARLHLMTLIGAASWDESLSLPELQRSLNAYRDAITVETQRECARRIREYEGCGTEECSVCSAEARREAADLIDPDKEN